MKLSQNFSREEFACSCNCGTDTVDTELLRLLENVRNYFNQPVKINSACRCKGHNQSVGGVPTSQHLYGRAADIVVKDIPPDDVAAFAKSIMLTGGIGKYKTFVHLDTRTNNRVVEWGD